MLRNADKLYRFWWLGFWRLQWWRHWQLMQAGYSRFGLWKERRNRRNGWSCTESDKSFLLWPLSPPSLVHHVVREARCQPVHGGFCRTCMVHLVMWKANTHFRSADIQKFQFLREICLKLCNSVTIWSTFQGGKVQRWSIRGKNCSKFV